MNEPDAGTQVTDPTAAPATDATAAGQKQVLITDVGDGTFTIQPMTDGQPSGDPVPAKSIDEALQGATDALGASAAPAESANPDQAGDQGAAANPDATGDASAAPEGDQAATDEADAKARYAQKRGTRPKVMPDWSDYQSGGNPAAK
jgi:hypothetical protein